MPRNLVYLILTAACVANAFAAEPQKRALLVGCTRYPNLPDSLQLQGPGNDVRLMREMLVARFGFPADQVHVLAEDEPAGEAARPTRANIEREFQWLASESQRNDQVVVLMAGHGSQQPDQDATDDADREPDGLDEIFLPADVGQWSGATGRVEQAIADDDLRGWLQAIQDRGASIWVVMDACHSGTMVRGADAEVVRQIPPGLLVPEAAIQAAQQRGRAAGEATRGGPAEDAGSELGQAASLVAMYAAQSNEVTVEKALPFGSPDSKRHGLFTYTISQVLTQAAAPLTYRELVDRVQARYVQAGRTFPTPLVEGLDRDREILGSKQWPGRSRVVLRDGDDGLLVSAGALQGLTDNSILAVYPPPGEPRTPQPLGYVSIVETRTLDALVEPCEHGGLPADEKRLPIGGTCEPAVIDCGDLRLRVAVDPLDNLGQPVPESERQRLDQELQQLGSADASLIEAVSEPAAADWLVRSHAGQTYLMPAAGAMIESPQTGLPALFGPAADGEPLAGWLKDRLERIARAKNLTRLTALSAEDAGDAAGLQAGLELRLLRSRTDQEGIAVPPDARGTTLYDGDRVSFRLHNPGRVPIDATLLYIDSAFGITCLFPQDGEINRLRPGDAMPIRIRVTSDTAGLEHLVVVAVRAVEGQPVDFSALAQPSLEQAQQVERTRGGPAQSLRSPLGSLFQRALYAQGTTRGVQRDTLDDHILRLFSWHILADKRPPANP